MKMIWEKFLHLPYYEGSLGPVLVRGWTIRHEIDKMASNTVMVQLHGYSYNIKVTDNVCLESESGKGRSKNAQNGN